MGGLCSCSAGEAMGTVGLQLSTHSLAAAFASEEDAGVCPGIPVMWVCWVSRGTSNAVTVMGRGAASSMANKAELFKFELFKFKLFNFQLPSASLKTPLAMFDGC